MGAGDLEQGREAYCFLRSFASMLILGAGGDGERVGRHIARRAPESRAPAGHERVRELAAG